MKILTARTSPSREGIIKEMKSGKLGVDLGKRIDFWPEVAIHLETSRK